MSVATPSPQSELSFPIESVRRFSVAEYHAMIEHGVLNDDERVELLDGWLISKMNRGPSHRAATKLVEIALAKRFGTGWVVWVQDPVTLAESEPEPDIAITRGEVRHFAKRHPNGSEVVLVAEVADTSLAQDRGIKRKLYAAAGIPQYWIVNLAEKLIEVYSFTGSKLLDYDNRRDYRPGQTIPVVVDGTELAQIPVEELLP